MNIIRPLSSLRMTALQRPPGYLEDCLRYGRRTGDLVEFTPEAFSYIRRKYSAPRRLASRTTVQGFTAPPRLGDRLHAAFGPIGTALHWPCMDRSSPVPHALKPGSPCARLRSLANKLP